MWRFCDRCFGRDGTGFVDGVRVFGRWFVDGDRSVVGDMPEDRGEAGRYIWVCEVLSKMWAVWLRVWCLAGFMLARRVEGFVDMCMLVR